MSAVLPNDYLDYPLRRHGMDHDRYDWSMLPRRTPVRWPGGARIALWVVPALSPANVHFSLLHSYYPLIMTIIGACSSNRFPNFIPSVLSSLG